MLARNERVIPLLLMVAVVALFLPPGGLRDWWYPDEPDVALPAIEMQARGDWVVPTHNGTPWLDYPPLAYWSSRAVGSLTGEVTPWGTRVAMALFAAVLVAITAWMGRKAGDPQRGLLAGVVLLATPTLWFHATNLQVDLGYATAITLGLVLYHHADSLEGSRSWWMRIAAFACFGAAILGKGPLGVLLPGLILTCWHAWNREWARLLWLAPLALVSLAVVAPWYALLCERLGTDFVLQEIMAQNFDRFGESKRGHGNKGVHYYLTRLPADLGLWTLFIIPALWQGFRTRRDDRTWRLLVLWVLAPLIFFTLASTKRNVYLLPIFPALALLIAEWLSQSASVWEQRWQTWSGRVTSGLLIVVGLALIVAGILWTSLPVPSRMSLYVWSWLRPSAFAIGLWLVIAGAWSLRHTFTPSPSMWLHLSGTITGGFVLVLWLVMPAIDKIRSYQPAAQWLVEQVPPDGVVGFHVPGRENTKRPAWLCHLEGRRFEFLRTPLEAQAWLSGASGRLLLSSPTHAQRLPQAHVVRSWQISTDSWVVLRATP